MKLNLTTLALLAFAACQPKPVETTNSVATDSTSDQSASVVDEGDIEEDTDELMELSSGSSIFVIETSSRAQALVGRNISVMRDSTDEADELFQTENFEPVVINAQTAVRYPLDTDLCSQYFRYQVAFLNGHDIDGWVEGLAVILPDEEGQSYEINGNEYKLMSGQDSGIGPDNEDGLTGCNRYVIPYLYNEKTKKASFFTFAEGVDFYPQDLMIERFFDRWLCFVSSEGGNAYIASVSVSDEGQITFNIEISYQDGGASATIEAYEKSEGEFVVTYVGRVETDEGEGD